jgi:glycerol-3-phosphate acyltransferase PlsY
VTEEGTPVRLLAAALFALALGAVPFSWLLGRLRGVDLRATGSGNVGATNLTRAAGAGFGILGLLLDASKGAAAVLMARWLAGEGSPEAPAAAGALSVVAHSFTPFLRFRGGKGVATGAGVFAVLAPKAALVALGAFAIPFALTRIVAAGSIVAAIVLPAAILWLYADRSAAIAAALLGILVIARHRDNIRRMIAGREHRLGGGARHGAPPGGRG